MDMVTSVVIVGSGFTGFECARRLARRLRKTDVDVTIISPVDYMLYTPLLPDVAGGVVDARFVAIPLAGTLKGVRAIRGRVDSVDLDGPPAAIHRSRTSHPRAVLGPAGIDSRLGDPPVRHPRISPVRKGFEVDGRGALSARSRAGAIGVVLPGRGRRSRRSARRTIVVVGASYSGTELVLQLRALAHAAAKQMNFDPASVKFLLLDLAEQVMPEVGEKLGARAQRVLRKRGVDVRLGLTLNEVHRGPRRTQRQFTGRHPHRRMGDGGDRRTADRDARVCRPRRAG